MGECLFIEIIDSVAEYTRVKYIRNKQFKFQPVFVEFFMGF